MLRKVLEAIRRASPLVRVSTRVGIFTGRVLLIEEVSPFGECGVFDVYDSELKRRELVIIPLARCLLAYGLKDASITAGLSGEAPFKTPAKLADLIAAGNPLRVAWTGRYAVDVRPLEFLDNVPFGRFLVGDWVAPVDNSADLALDLSPTPQYEGADSRQVTLFRVEEIDSVSLFRNPSFTSIMDSVPPPNKMFSVLQFFERIEPAGVDIQSGGTQTGTYTIKRFGKLETTIILEVADENAAAPDDRKTFVDVLAAANVSGRVRPDQTTVGVVLLDGSLSAPADVTAA